MVYPPQPASCNIKTMAWEKGRKYYTRSRRDGQRVVREYVGGGLVGQLAAAEDAQRRLVSAVFRAEVTRARELAKALRESDAIDDVLVAASLEALGFHRTWRRWRLRHVTGPVDPEPAEVACGGV